MRKRVRKRSWWGWWEGNACCEEFDPEAMRMGTGFGRGRGVKQREFKSFDSFDGNWTTHLEAYRDLRAKGNNRSNDSKNSAVWIQC
jgi:hypothetical protein